MSIVKDAFSDLFQKKPKESEEEMVNRLENDLKEYRKKMQDKQAKEQPPKELKLQPPTPEPSEPLPRIDEQDIDRVSILEQNMLAVMQDFHERLGNIEQYLVAKK